MILSLIVSDFAQKFKPILMMKVRIKMKIKLIFNWE